MSCGLRYHVIIATFALIFACLPHKGHGQHLRNINPARQSRGWTPGGVGIPRSPLSPLNLFGGGMLAGILHADQQKHAGRYLGLNPYQSPHHQDPTKPTCATNSSWATIACVVDATQSAIVGFRNDTKNKIISLESMGKEKMDAIKQKIKDRACDLLDDHSPLKCGECDTPMGNCLFASKNHQMEESFTELTVPSVLTWSKMCVEFDIPSTPSTTPFAFKIGLSIEFAKGKNCDADEGTSCYLQLVGTFHVAIRMEGVPVTVALEGEVDISSTAIPACGSDGNEGQSFFQSFHCGHLKLFTTYFYHWIKSVMAKPEFTKAAMVSTMREKAEVMAEHGRAADDEDMYEFIAETVKAKDVGFKMHPLYRAGVVWNTLLVTKALPAMALAKDIDIFLGVFGEKEMKFYSNREIIKSMDDTASTDSLNQFEYECLEITGHQERENRKKELEKERTRQANPNYKENWFSSLRGETEEDLIARREFERLKLKKTSKAQLNTFYTDRNIDHTSDTFQANKKEKRRLELKKTLRLEVSEYKLSENGKYVATQVTRSLTCIKGTERTEPGRSLNGGFVMMAGWWYPGKYYITLLNDITAVTFTWCIGMYINCY